jgi:hypothetical protein
LRLLVACKRAVTANEPSPAIGEAAETIKRLPIAICANRQEGRDLLPCRIDPVDDDRMVRVLGLGNY